MSYDINLPEMIQGVLESVFIIIKTTKTKRVNGIELNISDGFEIVQGYAERDKDGLRTDHIYVDDDIYTFGEYYNYLRENDIRPTHMYESNYVFSSFEKAEKALTTLLFVLLSPTDKFKELAKKYPEALL